MRLILFLIVGCLFGLSRPAGADVLQTMDIDAVERSYLLHLPTDPDDGPIPLVMAFHGGGGSAASFRKLTGLNDAADEHGFAVAYLQADNANGQAIWGTYRDTTGDPAADLAFVDALIPELVGNHGLDPARVYATGLSNGGEMSFLLGLTRPDTIAAIAPVGMHLTPALTENTSPSRPIPTLNIVGWEDPQVPFDGGTIAASGDAVLSSAETLAFLRTLNGVADQTVEITMLPDTADDGTTSVRNAFHAVGPNEADLQRITVIGGGHTWPGSPVNVDESLLGLTAQDFNANDQIWAFFQTQAIPEPGSAVLMLLGAGTLFLQRRTLLPRSRKKRRVSY